MPAIDLVALRDALDERALAGADWHELVARLAAATGVGFRLVAADGALLVDAVAPADATGRTPASSTDFDRFHQSRVAVLMSDTVDHVFAHAGASTTSDRAVDVVLLDGTHGRATAVAAGERRVGALVALRSEAPDHARDAESDTVVDAVLGIGATAIAIEAVRRDARAAAVAESAGWLIDELRFGSRRPPEELSRVALRYGVRLDEPHAAVVLRYDGPDAAVWATGVSWLETPVRHLGATAWTVVNGDVAHEVDWMQRRLQPFVHGRIRVASGPLVTGAEHSGRSFDLAAGALAVLQQQAERSAVTYEQLGLTGLLLAVPHEQLEAFVHRQLGPLLDRPDLLETLDAWFATGGSRAAVAEAVGLHRNSVGYRIERIRALLQHDPDDPTAAVDLRAALAARTVLAARRATVLAART